MESILSQVKPGSQLGAFQNVLVAFKSRGGSKEEAYEVLKDVRVLHQWNEETEDLILEVMDIVSGFCSPSLRIWENE